MKSWEDIAQKLESKLFDQWISDQWQSLDNQLAIVQKDITIALNKMFDTQWIERAITEGPISPDDQASLAAQCLASRQMKTIKSYLAELQDMLDKLWFDAAKKIYGESTDYYVKVFNETAPKGIEFRAHVYPTELNNLKAIRYDGYAWNEITKELISSMIPNIRAIIVDSINSQPDIMRVRNLTNQRFEKAWDGLTAKFGLAFNQFMIAIYKQAEIDLRILEKAK